ncbi:MAG TPA: NADH-quinone oxidoreductase subunit H, partial [Acidimicrobiales bacterium]|nr:NADH-quinone oxidoreductase subunit H [Acidimicrobiales bacterium]
RWVFPILWFFVKTVVFAFSYVWFRAALPRFRYDQLMDLGWKKLIPLSLGWLIVVAGFLIAPAWGFAMGAVVLLAWTMLTRAFEIGTTRERGAEAVLPVIGARPLPPEVLREITDEGNV